MRRSYLLWIILILLLFSGCIEPIEFDTDEEERRVVIDGFISNISYNDRLTMPVTPERFSVNLQYTGPVNNERNEQITGAEVTLYDDEGLALNYYWDFELSKYILPYDDFAAEENKCYYLEVVTPSGEVYKSDMEKLYPAPPLNEVEYRHDTRIEEIETGTEVSFTEQRGVVLSAVIQDHPDDEEYRFRYKITPSWVFVAPLRPDISCYVTNKFYFQKIVTHTDKSGGYPFDLFFLDTEGNDRIEVDFTALVTQYSLSPHAYEFWDQLALQAGSGGGIFDPPPFELTSNVYNVSDESEKVSGFFSVVHESSVRWFINASELPYDIDFGPNPCAMPPLTPDCTDCLEYRGGSSDNTLERPDWWRNY